MKVRIFAATAQHQVVTFVENERSPTEDFLFFGEKVRLQAVKDWSFFYKWLLN
ncbi:hypothetical protein KZZ10_10440 [Alcaligenaceae bacterium LF4-65]|uniref:Uncharacterized protein n=1 Tax=Zwartia hollandica TaxID=324606 RepID=A0A953T7U7_9BURK|nr:hypothetical protein [Zwartia hollandica]